MTIHHKGQYRSLAVAALALPWIACAAKDGEKLFNPLQFETIPEFLRALLGAVMYLGLPVIALVIVFAGFMFVTSQGNTEKIKAAIYNFQWVVIGTALFLGAWALTNIIEGTINMLRDGA